MTTRNHSQDERFTIRGHWWLPGSTHKVAGDLIYGVGDLSLALYGGLNDAVVADLFSIKPEHTEFPAIHGESLDGKPITSLISFYTAWKPDLRTLLVRPNTRVALLSSRLTCHAMIEGSHLSSPDDGFTKCRIEVPDLETWLGDSPFLMEMTGLAAR